MTHDPERFAAHLRRWDNIGRWSRRIGAALIIAGILLAAAVLAT
jgi:hypothetical protein